MSKRIYFQGNYVCANMLKNNAQIKKSKTLIYQNDIERLKQSDITIAEKLKGRKDTPPKK